MVDTIVFFLLLEKTSVISNSLIPLIDLTFYQNLSLQKVSHLDRNVVYR